MDREKVVKGLECCSQPKKENCMQCPYRYPMYPSGDREDWLKSCQELYKDTLALLNEQENEIENLKTLILGYETGAIKKR